VPGAAGTKRGRIGLRPQFDRYAGTFAVMEGKPVPSPHQEFVANQRIFLGADRCGTKRVRNDAVVDRCFTLQ